MKKFLLLSVAATLICSLSFAKILRVGYGGIVRANVDYGTLNEANDAAAAGDTIQVYGDVSGSLGSITKKLVIIGYGYNLDANNGLQAIGTDAPSKVYITFLLGSDGSSIQGCSGSFYVQAHDPITNQGNGTAVSNITFQRCKGTFEMTNIAQYGPINNIKIISSVIASGGMQSSGVNDFPVTNLQVYNCIIQIFTLYKTASTASFINCAGPTQIGGYAYPQLSLNDAGCLIKNCALYISNASLNVNTIYENNFFSEGQPNPVPSGSNNRWSQDWGVLFNRLGGTNNNVGLYAVPEFDEDYYVLKAGSPAINGGFNAANQPTNCGIYGGEAAYVYKLSGVPAVPAIYKLTAPSLNASANPYNVTISVRSNN